MTDDYGYLENAIWMYFESEDDVPAFADWLRKQADEVEHAHYSVLHELDEEDEVHAAFEEIVERLEEGGTE